jgi:hypothetical protein
MSNIQEINVWELKIGKYTNKKKIKNNNSITIKNFIYQLNIIFRSL